MADLESLQAGAHLASPAAMGNLLTGGAYRRARHINYLNEKLVDLAMGEITRLMVLMPPRHGKSETCSHWFPAWLVSLWPMIKIMLATYGFDLARENAIKVRNTLVEHSPQLGVYLAKDTKAAARWKTAQGGGMLATGVRGALTGRGANVLILDDAVKDHAEAASPLLQKRNWSWWQSTFRSRLHANGKILAVGTRWNENDLLGMLLQAFERGPGAEGYEPWTIVCFPAEAEEHDLLGRRPARDPDSPDLELSIGDPLWPEGGPDGQYGREWIRSTKIATGSYWWAAVYQQRPAPMEGGIIKKKWIKRYEETPDQVDEIATSWDMSFKKAGTSFVVGQCWARVGANFYLLEQARGKWDFVETLAEVRAMAERWPEARAHYVEDKANGSAVIATLHNEISGIIPVEPEGGKDSRLFAVSHLFEAGNVFFPQGELWSDDLVYELVSYPNAANDDQVDACSQALTRMSVRSYRQGEITMGALNTRINELPIGEGRAPEDVPLDRFGYTPGEQDDDEDELPPPRKRIRFGYDA